MKSPWTLGIVLLFPFQVGLIGQQLPMLTQHKEYHSSINPGNLDNDFFQYPTLHRLNLSSLQQNVWGIEGGHTQIINWTFIWTRKNNFRLFSGINLLNDKFGKTGFLRGEGRIGVVAGGFQHDYMLSFGINVAFDRFVLHSSRAQTLVPNDPLTLTDFVQFGNDVGLGGAFIKRIKREPLNGDEFHIGFSMVQNFSYDFSYRSNDGKYPTFFNGGNYFFNIGFNKYLSGENHYWIESSFWLKHLAASYGSFLKLDAKLRFHSEQVLFGLGLGNKPTITAEIGYKLGSVGKSTISIDGAPYMIGISWDHSNFGPFQGSGFAKVNTYRLFLSFPLGTS